MLLSYQEANAQWYEVKCYVSRLRDSKLAPLWKWPYFVLIQNIISASETFLSLSILSLRLSPNSHSYCSRFIFSPTKI